MNLREFFRPSIEKIVPAIAPWAVFGYLFYNIVYYSYNINSANIWFFRIMVIVLGLVWLFYFYALSCLVPSVIRLYSKS